MTTFTAVITSHANEPGLRVILGNLRYQTRPPDETIVLCSNTPDLLRLQEHFPEVDFYERPDRSDWGHEKRSQGIWIARSDWLGFFNDDDSYTLDYLEKMLSRAKETDVDAVYCSWSECPDGGFRLYQATAGNFIVRTELARRAGYDGRHYEADGQFIDAVSVLARRVVKVEEILYQHNLQ